MADIDSILAGVGGNTRADFSGIGNLPKAYWEGKDQAAKNDLREAFKDGIPLTSEGQPDFASMAKTLFQKGGLSEGMAAAGQGLAQQKLQYGQRINESLNPPSGPPSGPFISPATSRNPVAIDPSIRAPVSAAPAGTAEQGGVTPASFLDKQGISGYNREVGLSYFKRNGIDPDQIFDPNDPAVAKKLGPVLQRLKSVGQVMPPQPGDIPPQMAQQPQPGVAPPQQQAPQQPPAPDFNQRFNAARPGQGSDPTLGGLVPAGRTPEDQLNRLRQAVGSGMLDPEQAKAATVAIEGITKAIEPTGSMKEYDKAVKQGFKGTLEDWQNRTDDNTTQRDILTKSLIPRIEKSQETATSAIQDIDAIHRSRNELDQKGGVITGVWANDRLKLAKIGNSLGIENSDKITNTEAFSAAVGKRVAAMVKAFGSGTAISDGDRRFAEKMAGGGIELNETSMRRILDIGEQADRAIIDRHNTFSDKVVKANEGLKSARDTFIVPQPGQYKKPDAASLASSAAFSAARSAIDKGAPRDAVMKRLRENGHDPAGL